MPIVNHRLDITETWRGEQSHYYYFGFLILFNLPPHQVSYRVSVLAVSDTRFYALPTFWK